MLMSYLIKYIAENILNTLGQRPKRFRLYAYLLAHQVTMMETITQRSSLTLLLLTHILLPLFRLTSTAWKLSVCLCQVIYINIYSYIHACFIFNFCAHGLWNSHNIFIFSRILYCCYCVQTHCFIRTLEILPLDRFYISSFQNTNSLAHINQYAIFMQTIHKTNLFIWKWFLSLALKISNAKFVPSHVIEI